MRRPFVIGVTGGIASGKSAVLSTLAALGAEVIDADLVYHELIVPGSPLNLALQAAFGAAIATVEGAIDRGALGRIVFNDQAALARLDAVTHPAVGAEIERRVARSTSPVVAVDAVKLIEGGLNRICDQVWVVKVDRETQISRLAARNGISYEAAARRVDAHTTRDDQLRAADVVIDNSGTLESTQSTVRELWRAISLLPLCQ